MQASNLTRVIGKPFVVKPDGKIIALKKNMIMALSVGDVFSAPEGKNAWFAFQNGDQIDVLDQSYILTTHGNKVVETNTELINKKKPASDEDSSTEFEITTENLVLHGLTNEQAKSLVLRRFEAYLSQLENEAESEIYFEPQVFRICENQIMNFDMEKLTSFVKGTKVKSFSLDEIIFEENLAEIIHDSDHFTIYPKSSLNTEINIQIKLKSELEETQGQITFVVQPTTNKSKLELISHKIELYDIKENHIVADISYHGFKEEKVKLQIINDPNNYFFAIKDNHILLTKDGIEAIINKTLNPEELEVTVQAKDDSQIIEKTIAIPVEIKSVKKLEKPNKSVYESVQQSLEDFNINTKPIESKTDEIGLESNDETEDQNVNKEIKLQEVQEVQEVQENNPEIDIESTTKFISPQEKTSEEYSNKVFNFRFDKKKVTEKSISDFIPKQDKINLTAIINLKENKDINEYLYIENDISGMMVLNISPSGDGKINQQIVFENINIAMTAKSYDIDLTNLTHSQISQKLINTMLKNNSLAV